MTGQQQITNRRPQPGPRSSDVARNRSQLRSPVVAAALSFLLPGLGQAAAGAPRRGAIVAIPALCFLAALGLILIFARSSLFGLALNQGELTSLLLVDVVALVYHLWAVVDSYLLAAPARPDRRRAGVSAGKWVAVLGVGLILSGTLAIHAAVAEVDMSWQHALYCLTATTPCWATDISGSQGSIATDDPGQGDLSGITDTSSPAPSGSVPSSAPLTTFSLSSLSSFTTSTGPWSWNPNGQFNVLLAGIGVQNNPSQLGPDTIMVLHVDRASGRATLISVGRNNYCVPLPEEAAKHFATSANGCPPYTWPQMINGLPNEVLGHCNYFPVPAYQATCGQPGDPNRYIRAYKVFEETIGGLLGLTIDGSMWINPIGLTTLINDLGGIDINVPTTVYDKPCGPAGSWQHAYYNCAYAHNGYSVPTGAAGVQRMIADAAKSGGKQSMSWHQGQDVAFVIKKGQQHMDGDWALAYARTRVFTNGGDFNRAGRQQLVLKALRADVDPCKYASPEGVASLLSTLQDIPYAFNSDMPITNPQNLQQWASLAKNVLGGNVSSLVLDPTVTGQPSVNAGGIWYPAVDATSWTKIKSLVTHSLDKAAVATASSADGSGGGAGGGSGC
jgi:anionic cell wall polymer biosynthesis LytR-Cps2A-Psr (LCP) family protein